MDRDQPRFVSEEAEELVRGLEAVSNDLSSLAAFWRGAAALRSQAPDADTQAQHLSAIFAETAVLRGSQTSGAPARAPERSVLRSRWIKVGAIGAAAVLTTGGLAAAQTLPAPAQNAVAAVAQAIGIEIPRADDEPDAPSGVDRSGDDDGDGIPNGEDPNTPPKDGLDHDGDGVPDDNGRRAGEPKKDGLDHDGDGVADDSGTRTGPSEGRGNAERSEATHGPSEPKTPKPDKTANPNAPTSPRGGGNAPEKDTGPPEDPGRPSND